VIHGGTNFGWGAGANAKGDGSKFEPSITSYDYGAPINERGAATAQYHDLRRIIHDALGQRAPAIPATPPALSFDPVKTTPVGSVWNALPAAIDIERPKPMELLSGQTTGVILYRTWLAPEHAGELRIDGLHDEALVLVDGERLGSLSRVAAAKLPPSLVLPRATKPGTRRLDIVVFPYGRVNYGRYMSDRKGIIGKVTLGASELLHWKAFGLPLDTANLEQIASAPAGQDGLLHTASFTVSKAADTFIDMSGWGLGFVWVNGHLLGRHSSLGPQTRLYCPGEWLKAGANRIVVFDLYAKPGLAIAGVAESDTEAKAKA
jgi:beta-galactosidase